MNNNRKPPVLNSYTVVLLWLVLIAVCTYIFQQVLDKQYNPNQTLEILVNEDGEKQIVLKRNQYGHYLATGKINHKKVNFFVDTGATYVSVPGHLAEHLNLTKGQQYQSSTANGLSTSFETTITELSLGGITMKNVPASIGMGMEFNEVLLGMSFLKHLKIAQQGNHLILSLPE